MTQLFRNLSQSFYDRFRRHLSRHSESATWGAVLGFLGKSASDFLYDDEFYRRTYEKYGPFAQSFVELVNKRFAPSSVVDVGCGRGLYLSRFLQLGKTVRGYEGSKAAIRQSLIPTELVHYIDLRVPDHPLDLRFDLCMSIEVAEHLPATAAEKYVRFLCAHSDTILFTAAPPGQGGTGHVNEQPPEYWQQLFEQEAFYLCADTTAEMKTAMEAFDCDQTENYVISNFMVFRAESSESEGA